MLKKYPSLLQLVKLLAFYLLLNLIFLSVIIFGEILFNEKLVERITTNGWGFLIGYFMTMGGAFLYALTQVGGWTTISWTGNFSIKMLLLSTIACLGIGILSSELILSWVPQSISDFSSLTDSIKPNIATFLAIVWLAPILEEFLFRGIILEGLLTRMDPWKAIILSSFCFSLIHFHLLQGLNAFLLGTYIGWVYWRSKSLKTCFYMHLVNNLLFFVGVNMEDFEDMSTLTNSFEEKGWYLSLLIGIAVITSVSIWKISKSSSKFCL